MKTCKKGLHQYASTLKQCPECHKAIRKVYDATPERKTSQKAYQRSYKASPKRKASQKVYKAAHQKAYQVANREVVNSFSAKRRASKLQRTPKWLTRSENCIKGNR